MNKKTVLSFVFGTAIGAAAFWGVNRIARSCAESVALLNKALSAESRPDNSGEPWCYENCWCLDAFIVERVPDVRTPMEQVFTNRNRRIMEIEWHDFQRREYFATRDIEPLFDTTRTEVCFRTWTHGDISAAVINEFLRTHQNNLLLLRKRYATSMELFGLDRLFCNRAIFVSARAANNNMNIPQNLRFLGGRFHENNRWTLEQARRAYGNWPGAITANPPESEWRNIRPGSIIILFRQHYTHAVVAVGNGYVSQFDNRVWVQNPYGRPVVASFFGTRFEYLEHFARLFDNMHVINKHRIMTRKLDMLSPAERRRLSDRQAVR